MSFVRVLTAAASLLALVAAGPSAIAETSNNGAGDGPDAGTASESWMSEPDIRSALGGQAISGHYRNGRTFNERYGADGRLAYRDEFRSSGGHWSLVNGSFCTIYDGDASGGCYRVKRSGGNCYEFYFVARTEDEARSPRRPDWTARGWRTDAKSTCVEAANA